MLAHRVVAAETLDHLAPNHPAAQRSRRDLVRLHQAMRTRHLVLQGWQCLVAPARARTGLRILELGAGDGTLLLGVAQRMAPRWPKVQLTLLDRVNIVTPATLAAYAALGWSTQVLVADVLEWAAGPAQPSSPPPDEPPPKPPKEPLHVPVWDLISSALFLHHFEGKQLDLLLAAIAARSDRFFACEPRRSWLALAGSYLVGALGANAVTREDAVLSVRAGLSAREVTAHWPHGGPLWRMQEYAGGPFSHCFSAQRVGSS